MSQQPPSKVNIYVDKTEYVSANPGAPAIIPEDELSGQELNELQLQLESLRFQNEKYLRAHPEMKKMLNDFIIHAFKNKPKAEDLVEFSTDYFAIQKKQFE